MAELKLLCLPKTRIHKTAVVTDGKLLLKDSAGKKQIDLPGPYTLSWALFDAVGRLPRKVFGPIRFTLIDDFDQVKTEQVLSFRASQTVTIGKRKVRLHAYDHLGRGIMPWTYFVDDSGLVVLAVSGLKAFGLVKIGGAK